VSFSVVRGAHFAELDISQRYLCVQNGRRTKPEDFYNDLVKRNRETFGCAWGASELRQGMITLGREFISPNETFPCADDVLAEAADHSTEVDVAHYAAVHGTLPRLSNNALSQHRWLCEEWGSFLGMGPHPPPEPVRIIRTKARSAKPLDAGELAAQVSGLVADAVMARLAEMGLTPDLVKKVAAAAEKQPAGNPGTPWNPPSPRRAESPPQPGPSRQGGRNGQRRELAVQELTRIEQRWGNEVLDLTTSSLASPSTKAAPIARPRLEEDDELYFPPSSGSLLANPFEFLAKAVPVTPRRVTNQVPAAARIPARMASPPSHPFDRMPTVSPASQIWFPGRGRREAAALFSQSGARSSSPLRKMGRGVPDMSSDADMPADPSSSEEQDRPENSMDDFLVRDTPTGTQSSDSSLGTRGDTLTRNVHGLPGTSAIRDNIRGAIRDVVGDPNAHEKSDAQMLGILLVMRNRQDAMVTMRTGGGKSMLWLVPALLDPDAKFIVVCPFTVLLDQQCDNAQKAGLAAINYSRTTVIPGDVQILFVQVEHLSSLKLSQ
jgi:hypothetical protein